MTRDCTTSNMCRDRTVTATTEGWQDKRAHIARRSGGCSCLILWRVPHIAGHRRNVYEAAKVLYLFFFFHIAVPRHG